MRLKTWRQRVVSRVTALVLLAAGTMGTLLAQGLEEVASREWTGGRTTKVTSDGTCVTGGSSSAWNCPSWGGFVKPMPGTVCAMNVGNNNPTSFYTNKIRNCT